MAARTSKNNDKTTAQPPLLTEEGRENVCISLAIDLAEKQLRDGTASPSVINHYLKLGSPKSRLELELLKEDIKLTKAKTQATMESRELSELIQEAMHKFGIYSGESDPEVLED